MLRIDGVQETVVGEKTEGMVLGQLWLTGWAVCTSVCTIIDVLT